LLPLRLKGKWVRVQLVAVRCKTCVCIRIRIFVLLFQTRVSYDTAYYTNTPYDTSLVSCVCAYEWCGIFCSVRFVIMSV
jgi:hypothetical protein